VRARPEAALPSVRRKPSRHFYWSQAIATRQAELLHGASALRNLGGGGFDPNFRSYCVPAGGGRIWSHLLSDARLVRGFVEAQWSAVIAEPDRILAVGPGSPFTASEGTSTPFYVFEGTAT